MKAHREVHDGIEYIMFRCPGCRRSVHSITTNGVVKWTWNGSLEKPTFSPSVLVTYPANPKADEKFKEWRTARACHSFVRDGRIEFLSDSFHELKGQTVDLPDYE